MNLTDQDIRNTETLTARLRSRSKALTVSSALAITEGLTRKITEGGRTDYQEEGRDNGNSGYRWLERCR